MISELPSADEEEMPKMEELIISNAHEAISNGSSETNDEDTKPWTPIAKLKFINGHSELNGHSGLNGHSDLNGHNNLNGHDEENLKINGVN